MASTPWTRSIEMSTMCDGSRGQVEAQVGQDNVGVVAPLGPGVDHHGHGDEGRDVDKDGAKVLVEKDFPLQRNQFCLTPTVQRKRLTSLTRLASNWATFESNCRLIFLLYSGQF